MTKSVQKGLSKRHIAFIALGGAIGAGLFLGSAQAIAKAGPAVLIAYALSGAVAFLIARALGELTLNDPRDGSFTAYAEFYFGRWCGFVTGWSYWLSWVIVGMAELTAAGVFMRFWIPDLPQWVTALVALLILYGTNIVNVRLFGELEFWLALAKVIAVVAFIAAGLVLIARAVPLDGGVPSFANLWRHGMFPTGLIGMAGVLPIAFFGFGGIELIGFTARETDRPEDSVPKAINSVVARILIFYIGSLAVIMALFPWSRIDSHYSPFVLVLDRIGFGGAASLLNLIVISAVLSSCNSGIFATGRVLATLAQERHAPRALGRINKRELPGRAITASTIVMGVSVFLNYAIPSKVFGLLLGGAAVLLMWNWVVIAGAHLRYRRQATGAARPRIFPLPLYPVTNWLIIGFIFCVVLLMMTVLDMAPAVLSIAGWFAILTIIHVLRRPTSEA